MSGAEIFRRIRFADPLFTIGKLEEIISVKQGRSG